MVAEFGTVETSASSKIGADCFDQPGLFAGIIVDRIIFTDAITHFRLHSDDYRKLWPSRDPERLPDIVLHVPEIWVARTLQRRVIEHPKDTTDETTRLLRNVVVIIDHLKRDFGDSDKDDILAAAALCIAQRHRGRALKLDEARKLRGVGYRFDQEVLQACLAVAAHIGDMRLVQLFVEARDEASPLKDFWNLWKAGEGVSSVCDPNHRSHYMGFPLGVASRAGRLDIVWYLLDKGTTVPHLQGYHQGGPSGRYHSCIDHGIVAAVLGGHKALVYFFLEHPQCPRFKPLYFHHAISAASETNNVEILDMLLSKWESKSASWGPYELSSGALTDLAIACRYGSYEVAERLLRAGAPTSPPCLRLDISDSDRGPLVEAVLFGQVKIVKLLLRYQAFLQPPPHQILNLEMLVGRRPFGFLLTVQLAAYRGHAEIFEMLQHPWIFVDALGPTFPKSVPTIPRALGTLGFASRDA
ncbi:hypothetical protein K402DRAFT_453014 [Aulographum hederae CBS 113979]|uniref:Uncharacterized protein n=1 Tax=Aulographum hederae CBS 113979 TaxID=1176131 RepID=A0A6G1H5M2_9PEZI|nr:hypothetical protein K402DRAFT_453014 [Aulographum hederae CBS 113979]